MGVMGANGRIKQRRRWKEVASVLEIIFRSFWTWAGTVFLILVLAALVDPTVRALRRRGKGK